MPGRIHILFGGVEVAGPGAEGLCLHKVRSLTSLGGEGVPAVPRWVRNLSYQPLH